MPESAEEKDEAQDRRVERVGHLINGGHGRDEAVAIAYQEELERCALSGAVPPKRADYIRAGKEFRRKPGEPSRDYLSAALTEARKVLSHRDYAVIHQAARARAGGMASARSRTTSIEKGLLLGFDKLSRDELRDAHGRSELIAAAAGRLGIDSGADALAKSLWAELAKRKADAEEAATAQKLPREACAISYKGEFLFPHHKADVKNGSEQGSIDEWLLAKARADVEQSKLPPAVKKKAREHLDRHLAALRAEKGEPDAGGVHVPGTEWKQKKISVMFKSTEFEQYLYRIWSVLEVLFANREKIDQLRFAANRERKPQLVGELEDKTIWIVDSHDYERLKDMDLVEGGNWMEDPSLPPRTIYLAAWVLPEMYIFDAFHEAGESWLMEHLGLPYLQAHEIIVGYERQKRNAVGHIVLTKADRSKDPGVMLAMRLPETTAKQIAIDGGEPPESLHVTLAYLGRMSKVGADGLMRAGAAVGQIASTPILRGNLSGIGRFCATENSDGKDVIVRLVDVPGLTAMRARLCDFLRDAGVEYSEAHDYVPHITLAYVDPKAPMPKRAEPQDVYFDSIVLSVNDADTVFPLGQPDPLLEARLEALEEQLSSPVEISSTSDGTVSAYALPSEGQVEEIVAMSAGLDLEPGDLVVLGATSSGDLVVRQGSSSSVCGSYDDVMSKAEADRDRASHETPVPFVGPPDAPIVFVSGAPTELELARMEPLVGLDGKRFEDQYLKPLGLTKSEVALGFACPVVPRVPSYEIGGDETKPWADFVEEGLARWPNALVVAVGKAASEALGDRAFSWLPHPMAARSNEDRYTEQIDRKVRRIRKCLDDGFAPVHNKSRRATIVPGRVGNELASLPGRMSKVAKAAGEKQIVYGVVIDPYLVDTQEEWVPPAEAEAAAHDYLRQSRVMGREHSRKDQAEVVESWLEPYPSKEDYKKAMSLQPHRVYKRKFGEDVVHSGTWVVGVKLGDEAWAAYKRGEITGFSIGGFSCKTAMDSASMPKFTVVSQEQG